MIDGSTLVGIVIIGRNEGERLQACLASVVHSGYRVVYVDSGSSDNSVFFARSLGVDVLELDLSTPFSAARARNTGFYRLLELSAETRYVQFMDGDCVLMPTWLGTAVDFLDVNADFAIACGRRRERFPEASLYNRLIDLEWDTPIGEANSCGGDSLVRVAAFVAVGGFNPAVVAGEEPEMCVRLRAAGWRIMRLDCEMTRHDAAMTRFGQWWKRAIRSGYGGLAVYQRTAGQVPRPFARQIVSARIWVIGWPLLMLIACSVGAVFGGPKGAIAMGVVVALAVPALILRIVWRRVRRGTPFRVALPYSLLIMISKVPEILGQLRWLKESRQGIAPRVIEHRSADS